MHKKWIALLLAAVLLCGGCAGGEVEETTVPTESTEPIFGVENNEFGEEDFLSPEDTEPSGNTETEPEPEQTEPSVDEEDPDTQSGSEDSDFEDEDFEDPTDPPETVPMEELLATTYEQYEAMTSEEQVAFCEQFASMEDFMAWYNAAREQYDQEAPPVEVGDAPINIGDLIGGNP